MTQHGLKREPLLSSLHKQSLPRKRVGASNCSPQLLKTDNPSQSRKPWKRLGGHAMPHADHAGRGSLQSRTEKEDARMAVLLGSFNGFVLPFAEPTVVSYRLLGRAFESAHSRQGYDDYDCNHYCVILMRARPIPMSRGPIRRLKTGLFHCVDRSWVLTAAEPNALRPIAFQAYVVVHPDAREALYPNKRLLRRFRTSGSGASVPLSGPHKDTTS